MISVALGTRETMRTQASVEGTVQPVRYLARTMTNVSRYEEEAPCSRPCSRSSRCPSPRTPAVLAPGPHASFTVRGANIQDPLGHRFIVRGAVIAPGSLTDPGRARSTRRRSPACGTTRKRLAAMGVNTVRLDVSAVANSDERLAAIRHAVAAARAAHLVVILSVHGGTAEQALTFVSYLAAKFHKDRSVWLQPAFDPSCDGATADRNRCISWSAWRAEQRALVHAIRSAGMHSPILLSTPRRSGDLRLLAHYHLTDKGIIYGVHFHGGPRTKLTVANQKRLGKLFAGPRTRKFAIIVDDLSRVGPSGRVDRPGWTDDFTAFVANWTINRGGDGAIGAAWTRYGPDALRARHGANLSRFGATYASRFLALTYAMDHATRAPRGLRGALASGDSGHDVRVLQQDLVDRGYLADRRGHRHLRLRHRAGRHGPRRATTTSTRAARATASRPPSCARSRPAASGPSRSTAARRTSRSASASRRSCSCARAASSPARSTSRAAPAARRRPATSPSTPRRR